MITLIPTHFELHDEIDPDHAIASVAVFDETCSKIEISIPVNPEYWPEISAAIHEALKRIHEAQ